MGRGLTAALFLVALCFGTLRELRLEEFNDLRGQWQITIPSRPAYNGLAPLLSAAAAVGLPGAEARRG